MLGDPVCDVEVLGELFTSELTSLGLSAGFASSGCSKKLLEINQRLPIAYLGVISWSSDEFIQLV